MPEFSQENRQIGITTPLGEDVLLLRAFTIEEGISRLFNFRVDLGSESDKDSIDFKKIVGKSVTIRLDLPEDKKRYFNGFVNRFIESGADGKLSLYHMEVVPWTWFLTRVADCRIFQNMTIPDIIAQVFQSRGYSDFKKSLTGTYETREYCVQYRETDFNFVSRLMEKHGIFYYFEHTQEKHTLVLADSASAHPSLESGDMSYSIGGGDDANVISAWQTEQVMHSGKHTLNDYNFTTPATDLTESETTVFEAGDNSKYEIYDYPGEYLVSDVGTELAKVRIEEEEASHLVARGSGSCRAFSSGYKFDLKDHPRTAMNASYVITEVTHVASSGGYGHESESFQYSNHFACIPSTFDEKPIKFRPPRITPRPFVHGPQSALVVGKSGEEIWVDQYGRIRVQFYWDRKGKKDENSSCWVRVSQPWAGNGWGAMWIPRMGQEVIVTFEEGDPDRPLVIGRVYNAQQVVPYKLPDHQTVSTFRGNSSKGGGANPNEIRFEDKHGSEQIFINAERDMDQRVVVDSREFVGNNRHLNVGKIHVENIGADKHITVGANHVESIGNDMSLTVGHDRKEVIKNDQHLEIDNDQYEDIGMDVHRIIGNDRIEVVGNDQNLEVNNDMIESVSMNVHRTIGADHTEVVGGDKSLEIGGNRNEKITGDYSLSAMDISSAGKMNVVIEAGMQLTLSGPGGFISIGPTGVTIQGTMVMINSGGSAGSGSSPSTKSPKSPKEPKKPKPSDSPKNPELADKGPKFGESDPGSGFQGGGGDTGGGGSGDNF